MQKALDEIIGRVGVLSENTGRMEDMITDAMVNVGAELSNLAMRMPSFAAAMGITSSQMSETIRNAIILRARNGRDDCDKSGGGAKKIKKIIDAGKNCYSVD